MRQEAITSGCPGIVNVLEECTWTGLRLGQLSKGHTRIGRSQRLEQCVKPSSIFLGCCLSVISVVIPEYHRPASLGIKEIDVALVLEVQEPSSRAMWYQVRPFLLGHAMVEGIM